MPPDTSDVAHWRGILMRIGGDVDICDLSELGRLNAAYYECARASRWKESTQRYGSNLMENNLRLQDDLRSGRYRIGETVDFDIHERGKERHISAPCMRDRIVQKALMRWVLLPQVVPHLIYDNWASLRGRGTSMARRRVNMMLQRHARDHGPEGWVMVADVHDYFGSVSHATLRSQMEAILDVSPDLMRLVLLTIDGGCPGPVGLNLGSECPQIYAVEYMNPVDQWAKVVRGTRSYGRYMDDMLGLSPDRDEMEGLLRGIGEQSARLGLSLNMRKTHVLPLSRGFTFMQIRYSVDGTRVIRRPTREKVARERRRLRAHRRLCDRGEMDELQAHRCYMGWRGTLVAECNRVGRTLASLDALHDELFPSVVPATREGRDTLCAVEFERLGD